MLKLYSVDFTWGGGVVIVAESPENALEMLQENPPFNRCAEEFHSDDIQEYQITKGQVINFLGDM